jgi:hypothetical protein
MSDIKKYLTLSEQMSIVDSVIQNCIKVDNGINKVDIVLKNFYLNRFVLEIAAGVEFPDDKSHEEIYESKRNDGTLEKVYDECVDYYVVAEAVDAQIETKMRENSIEHVVNNLGMQLLEKIDKYMTPKAITKLIKSIEKINPEFKGLLENFIKEVK